MRQKAQRRSGPADLLNAIVGVGSELLEPRPSATRFWQISGSVAPDRVSLVLAKAVARLHPGGLQALVAEPALTEVVLRRGLLE